MLKKVAKQGVYMLWVLFGFIGWKIQIKSQQTLTVLITYYSPARLRHVNHQIRNILKCAFVEKVIISCHNPDVKIQEHVSVRDPRLVLLNQSVRRACGYRWNVAREYASDYLVVVDDDIVLFPWQLKVLFENLLLAPGVPHGLSGMIYNEDGDLEFHQREDIEVQYLTEIYAVTKEQVEQYFEMVNIFGEQDPNLPTEIEYLGDFVVISQTGPQNPRIHKAGRLFRDDTYNAQGTANHKEQQFSIIVNKVAQAVRALRSQLFV